MTATGVSDPQTILVPFGYPIVIYLTLAAIAAGTALLAVWMLLRGEATERVAGRRGLLVATFAILVGGLSLVLDLEAPGLFAYILRYFNPASMIAWGARAITVFGLLTAFAWWALGRDTDACGSPRVRGIMPAALLLIALLAGFIGLYPAWVLAQSTARPLWASPLLAPLLFLSAVHAGVAVHLLGRGARRWHGLGLELALVVLQAVVFVLYLLQIDSAYGVAKARIMTGSLAPWLWVGVVLIGWLVPLALARRGDAGDSGTGVGLGAWRAVAILIGVLALRAVLVFGGQGAEALIASVL